MTFCLLFCLLSVFLLFAAGIPLPCIAYLKNLRATSGAEFILMTCRSSRATGKREKPSRTGQKKKLEPTTSPREGIVGGDLISRES